MTEAQQTQPVVDVIRPTGASSVVLVCEHASAAIPPGLGDLGLGAEALNSHIAWDPGALAIAQHLSAHLDAVLVASRVSRLVYDCNRPPDAPDAMPAKSERFDVPGNARLTQTQRAARAAQFYDPFRVALAAQIARKTAPVVVTLHSFTRSYLGADRAVEIGILHDSDTRLADAFLATAATHTSQDVERNAPYGPQDGVTHTLRTHALPGAHLNVMLEIRNDLIATPDSQARMAACLAAWTKDALSTLKVGV